MLNRLLNRPITLKNPQQTRCNVGHFLEYKNQFGWELQEIVDSDGRVKTIADHHGLTNREMIMLLNGLIKGVSYGRKSDFSHHMMK